MGRPKETSDEDLVRAALSGDREGFGELVRRYERQAFASALSFLGHEDDAMDVVQDAFLTAYCRLGQLRQPCRFAGWLREIVRSLCLQHRRRQARGPALIHTASRQLDNTPADPQQVDPTAAERPDIWNAVAGLPQIYREAVLLRCEGGLSYKEVASTLGLPVSTVKGRLQQGHLKLRRRLIPKGEAAMERQSVCDEVMKDVCKIAREEISQKIPLGMDRRVVLYCFVPARIEVTGTDGDAVVLGGEKLAVGHTEDEAQANLAEMKIRFDEVQDWAVAGPHPGQVFCGTNTGMDGNPSAIVREVDAAAAGPRHPMGQSRSGLFPEMQVDVREALEAARERMQGGATRISLVWGSFMPNLNGFAPSRASCWRPIRRADRA